MVVYLISVEIVNAFSVLNVCFVFLAASDEQNRIFKIEVRLKDHLETEVNRLNEKVEKQSNEISSLEKEKERYRILLSPRGPIPRRKLKHFSSLD